jgi:hypothetical protein
MKVKALIFKRWVMRCVAVPKSALRPQAALSHVPVWVRIGGELWDSTLAPHDAQHWVLVVPSAILKSQGLNVGDEAVLDVRFDDARGAPELPDDLHAALQARPGLMQKFRAMSVSYQRQAVRYIERGKSADTREKYIEIFIEQVCEAADKRAAQSTQKPATKTAAKTTSAASKAAVKRPRVGSKN